MSGPSNQGDSNGPNAATMQALGTAVRAYAAMAPGSFPAGNQEPSSLGLPAAAIAAIAAAAGKFASQGQQLPPPQQQHQQQAQMQQQLHHPHQQQQPPPQQMANLAAAFAHSGHQAGPTQAQALALAAFLPGFATQQQHMGAPQQQQQQQQHGGNAAAFNHMAAILQGVATQMNVAAPAAAPAPTTTHSHPAQSVASQPTSYAAAAPTTAYAPPRPVTEASSLSSFGSANSHVVPARPAGSVSNSALVPNIQNWSIAQLEKHIKLLQQMNQPVPQSVALLLADARRKSDKKTAKRVANRKSACTSRARKKALVEEMTLTNARLRRQALILSLLPDLVIVISPEGEITFCSAQVERVLRHKMDDLIGADIRDILIPESRVALGKLVTGLMNSGKTSSRARGDQPSANAHGGGNKANDNGGRGEDGNDSSGSGNVSSGAPAVVSDQSFPPSVVKVDSKQEAAVAHDMDTSVETGEKVSSLSNSARSPSASMPNSGSSSEESNNKAAATATRKSPSAAAKGTRLSSSDDSSSGSTETGNIRKANENLERNVRWHNKKLSAKAKAGHKDDVLGDSVTANNALAKLSSLQHMPFKKRKASQVDSLGDRSSSDDSLSAGIEEKKKSANKDENASDDSGYRESNDSREETSSSASESSNSNGRSKPLAPACNVCLIRDDLTTLWCEVTSSIRTKRVEVDSHEDLTSLDGSKTDTKTGTLDEAVAPVEEKEKQPKMKELLLCLRPIRDGNGKVDKSLSFLRNWERTEETSSPVQETSPVAVATGEVTVPAVKLVPAVSNVDSGSGSGNTSLTEDTSSGEARRGPPKKRALPLHGSSAKAASTAGSPGNKRMKMSSSDMDLDKEKSVIESLMLMSNKSK